LPDKYFHSPESAPLVCVLVHIYPVNIQTAGKVEKQLNSFLPAMTNFSNLFLPFGLDWRFIHSSRLCYECYFPLKWHSHWFYHSIIVC